MIDNRELTESFMELARAKGIDRPTMIRIIEDVFRTMIRKQYGDDSNFDVIINSDGDLEIFRYREIVPDDSPELADDNTKISLSEARKIEADFEVGEEIAEPIDPQNFGRRVIMTGRQTLIQKIKDWEKERMFLKYKDLVGTIVTGEVYQVLRNRDLIVLDNEDNELLLPRNQQIPKDRYRKGDTIRAIVDKVELIHGSPKVILSRTSPVFLERLFEQEVPEVADGIIAIRKVVREPGERAKVAVESFDDRIDPVGACVGMRGSRIHAIVRELNNENIDVINYTDNLELLIARALAPAKLSAVKLEENGRVSVYLKLDQVPLAIGKNGLNIKLAGKLIGREIDVFREMDEEDEEDVDLREFQDEIEEWIIEEFRKVGFDTAKSVLAVPKEDLVRRTDLEEETIDYVLDILRKEFE
ncbi:N utilization substance protein A [Thermonema lapsum]|uniref:Transcription termination/antitermination protein NusA n=1 Tax=Thermonema lapsum TaxID=28195 RepID=A0A846MSJ6_9BACT|nr:N utilization substance protein A [Thermonema lapsum]